MKVRSGRAAAVVLLLVLLAAAACDDAVPLENKDRRVALAALPRNVCPDVGGTGSSDLIATVFGRDGNTQEGETVLFETTAGTVEPREAVSDFRGLARATLTAPRTPELTATARLKKGRGKDEAILRVPGRATASVVPTRFVSGFLTAYEVGENVEMRLDLIAACHAKTVGFRLEFDASVLSYVETRAGGSFSLAGADPVEVDITASPGAGDVDVVAVRDPSGDLDFTGRGDVVIVVLEAIAATPDDGSLAEFVVDGVFVQDGLGDFYDLDVVQPPGIVVDPADDPAP